MPGPGGMLPPPNQQLPPQMFTTAAQLLDMTDSKLHLGELVEDVPVYVGTWRLGLETCKSLFANLGIVSLCTEKLMVALRDGRKLIGVLRSWDQFGISPLPITSLYPHLHC